MANISFKSAFDQARNNGLRYFTYKGKEYNTIKEGETVRDWLNKFGIQSGNIYDLTADNNFAMMSVNPNYNATYDWRVPIRNNNLDKPVRNLVSDSLQGYAFSTPPPAPLLIDSSNSTLTNTPSLITSPPLTTWDRALTRQALRNRNINPYDYTGGLRRALRKYINSGGDVDEWIKNNPVPLYSYKLGGQVSNLKLIMEAFKLWVALKVLSGEVQESDLLDLNKVKLLFQVFLLEVLKNVLSARCGDKLRYFKCGDPITEFKKKKKQKVTKHDKGGWIDRKRGIWNWDSLDRMKRIMKWYREETDSISGNDLDYINLHPELESFLHNVYKNSKLPNKKIAILLNHAKDTNNMPKGADPEYNVWSAPDSVNNYKGRIGVEEFKMLPKLQALTASKPNNLRQQYYDLWAAYVKKHAPQYWGKFKKTMEDAGYTYNWDLGTYSDSKNSFRIHNGTLQVLSGNNGKWVDTELAL